LAKLLSFLRLVAKMLFIESRSFLLAWMDDTTRSRSVARAKNLYFSFSLPLMNSLEFSWSMMHTGFSTWRQSQG